MNVMLNPLRRPAALLAVAGAVLALSGCAIEWQNREPARQLARQAQPDGSVYTGWRVFEARCASCHGADAAGVTGGGPDLLARVRELGPRRFVGLVLSRYDWGLPPVPADAGAREALVDDVLASRQGVVTMPAWGGEPVVSAHISDLYAYLAARSEGRVGPGQPSR